MARIVIVGAAGSGKSTLLKAFGASLLSRRGEYSDGQPVGSHEVPFFVSIRAYARAQDEGTHSTSLLGYLAEQVRDAGVRNGEAYVRRLLRQKRLVLLLDGLDEIRDNSRRKFYNAVVSSIHEIDGLGSRA